MISNQFKELDNKMSIYNACIENVELQHYVTQNSGEIGGWGKMAVLCRAATLAKADFRLIVF